MNNKAVGTAPMSSCATWSTIDGSAEAGTSAPNITIPACWISSIMLIIGFDQAVRSVTFLTQRNLCLYQGRPLKRNALGWIGRAAVTAVTSREKLFKKGLAFQGNCPTLKNTT